MRRELLGRILGHQDPRALVRSWWEFGGVLGSLAGIVPVPASCGDHCADGYVRR